ncbi:LysR family transcriptional regulator [Streptomyces sp. NPDC008001]|uniref:LysR family transcriptional regulator n=1 Tax=Streptomyces sp. NPDC008001 TaxID=3364804 RepID=UPI0036F11853
MKLSQLAAFVAIADTGSFTKAATELGVTQSAVSHAIASLEAELCVGIMRRDRSGVDLTDAGRRILEHARSALTHTERIRIEASAPAAGASRRLLVGTSQSFSTRLLPRLIAEFRTRFRDVEIVLYEGDDRRIAEMLAQRSVDVGIVTLPKSDFLTYPLLADEMCVVVPRGHELAGETSLPVWRLAGQDIVLPTEGVEPTLRALFASAGTRLDVLHRIRDLHVLLSMVGEGLGVTVLPSLALPATPADLVAIPFAPAVTRHLAIGVREAPDECSPAMAFIRAAQTLARSRDCGHRRVPAVS